MRKYVNIGLALIGLLVAGNASAAVVVTVYDALDPMVSALTRVALMVSDSSFTSTAVAFGIAGLTVGAIMVLASIAQARVVNPISFAVPFLVGGVVLTAMLAPKEDIIVQDRATLQTETVFSFPAPMANLLSWLTQARDAIVDLIDTSAPPGPATIWQYRHNVNGITFDVLMRALSKAGTLPDQYLNATVEKYIADCMPWAVSIGAADWNDMNSGNVEFYDLLAKGAVGSQHTGYFTAANKQGVFDTCKNVWDNHLSTALQDAAHQDMFKKAIYGACEEHGIITDLRASTASGSLTGANAYCENIFAASVHAAVGESGAPPWGLGSVNAWRWMRQLYLGNKLYTWALNAPPGALANYNQILDRVGWAQQAAQWMPVLRATLIAIAIALLPLGVLFLMTGAGFRAILYILGMVVFVLIWEILDAAAHSFLIEWAFRALGDAVQHQIGLVGLAKQAPASVKIMTAFGTAKVLSATLATSFMYVVFRYGGMAMASMAQSFASGAKEAGSDAMRKTTEPVQHGQWMQALNQSSAAMFASHAVGGAGNYMAAGAYNAATDAHTALQTVSALGGSAGSGAQRMGAINGSAAGGRVQGTERAAAGLGISPGQAAQHAAAGQAAAQVADGMGKNRAFSEQSEGVRDAVDAAAAQAAQNMGYGRGMATGPGGSSPVDKGFGMGVVQAYRGMAAAQVAGIVAGTTGQSLYDGIAGQAGANQSIGLTGEQMGNAIDAMKREGLLNNMDGQLEQQLRQEGGVATISYGSQDGGFAPTSVSLSRTGSASEDTSSNVNSSNNRNSAVTNQSGVRTDNPGAAQDPGFQAAASNHFQGQLGAALASGDHDRTRGVIMAMMDQYQQELGVTTGAGANEITASGISADLHGSVGGEVLGTGVGAGARADLRNLRQNSGEATGPGYYAEAERLANMAEQKYAQATGQYELGSKEASAIVASAVAQEGRAWVEQQTSQVERSAVQQSDALPDESGGQQLLDATREIMDKGQEWIKDAKDLLD